jgi:hypothetical protein
LVCSERCGDQFSGIECTAAAKPDDAIRAGSLDFDAGPFDSRGGWCDIVDNLGCPMRCDHISNPYRNTGLGHTAIANDNGAGGAVG